LQGRGWRRAWGEPRLDVTLFGGERLALHAGGFLQVNAAANDALVATVLEFARCRPADRVLDLYAGFGNLTFPLARRARAVTAVERDRESARDGEAHARRHGYAGVTFVAADVPAFLDDCVRQGRAFDVAVLDPPRNGAAEAVEKLVRLAPARLVYVSCNPATLARDLRLLAPRYDVGRIQPLDFFPQTYHVEAVAELRLTEK
jgi:23S rRNA (uracil1939-C5)-methyltransferase